MATTLQFIKFIYFLIFSGHFFNILNFIYLLLEIGFFILYS